jgi:lysophospholipase L1-like esterase
MKSMNTVLAVAFLLIATLYGGCMNESPILSGPGLGGSQVVKYVAIGNSLSAGYQSNGLYESAQVYSFPNQIANQLKAAGAPLGSFEQPLWSDPGTPGADGKASRYEILNLVGPVVGPAGAAAGSPKNLALARPYDNLGIPGAILYDFLDTTSYATKALPFPSGRGNALFSAILRNPALGRRVLDQMRALRPDLITFWLGNNDVLGFATSGGTFPPAPTDLALFQGLYKASLDSIRVTLPNARIVVATIPNVTVIPFFTTVGPRIKALLPAGVALYYQKHAESGVATGTTAFTEANPPYICLTGISYAPYLGRPTGVWYRANGLSIPAGIDTTKPFGFHPQNPWPNALVLDVDEQNTATTFVNNYNTAIMAIAGAMSNVAVVDFNSFLNNVAAHGYSYAGQVYTTAYISGGMFSLDGVHPSSRGHGIVANEFIKVINAKWGMTIPLVNVSSLPGIAAPVYKGETLPVWTPEAIAGVELLARYGY